MRHHTSGSAASVISFPRMAVKPHSTTQTWIWNQAREWADMRSVSGSCDARAGTAPCTRHRSRGRLAAAAQQVLRADENVGELRAPAGREQVAQRPFVER